MCHDTFQHVLVVHKSSVYKARRDSKKDPHLESLDPPEVTKTISESHDEHYNSLDQITSDLTSLGINHSICERYDLPSQLNECNPSLVITVGGDGTVLMSAPYLEEIPLLGVNSAPTYSTGKLCCTRSDNFIKTIKNIKEEKLKTIALSRLQASIDGKLISDFALNDILFSHTAPAAVTKYIIELEGREVLQKSSGVWISTAAGSTAAICSAGGHILSLRDTHYQFLVRELCHRQMHQSPGWNQQIVPAEKSLSFISLMKTSLLSFDGFNRTYPLQYGEKIEINNRATPLSIFL